MGRYEIQNRDNRVQICAQCEQVHIHLWFQDEEKQGSLCPQVESLEPKVVRALRQRQHNLFRDRDARVSDLELHRLLNKLA